MGVPGEKNDSRDEDLMAEGKNKNGNKIVAKDSTSNGQGKASSPEDLEMVSSTSSASPEDDNDDADSSSRSLSSTSSPLSTPDGSSKPTNSPLPEDTAKSKDKDASQPVEDNRIELEGDIEATDSGKTEQKSVASDDALHDPDPPRSGSPAHDKRPLTLLNRTDRESEDNSHEPDSQSDPEEECGLGEIRSSDDETDTKDLTKSVSQELAVKRVPKRPLMQEIRRLPSQRYWNAPTDIHNPKSLFRKFRLMCGKIVDNPATQLFIISLIIINAIMMGIGTFDFVTNNPNVNEAFELVDRVFLSIFTIEIGLQFIYRLFALFTDAWLVFDVIIVVTSWSVASMQIVRSFRIFRAFRLVTRIGPLRELVMAIAAVMPRIYAIGMLLLLIFYIYAVLFTELFRTLTLSANYFTRLDASLFTCVELMTLEWADIAREVMAQMPWAWLPISTFIAITGFIVFNLIVAVICDAVKVVKEEISAEEHKDDPIVTSITKLKDAQTRIWDLSKEVQTMRSRQAELESAVEILAAELLGEPAGLGTDGEVNPESEEVSKSLALTEESLRVKAASLGSVYPFYSAASSSSPSPTSSSPVRRRSRQGFFSGRGWNSSTERTGFARRFSGRRRAHSDPADIEVLVTSNDPGHSSTNANSILKPSSFSPSTRRGGRKDSVKRSVSFEETPTEALAIRKAVAESLERETRSEEFLPGSD